MFDYQDVSWCVLIISAMTGLLLKRVHGIVNWRIRWYTVLTMNIIETITFALDGTGTLLSFSFLFWKSDWWLLIVIAGVSMAIVAVQFMIYATNLDRWWNIRLYYFPNSKLFTGLKPKDRQNAEFKYALGADSLANSQFAGHPINADSHAIHMYKYVNKLSMFAWL